MNYIRHVACFRVVLLLPRKVEWLCFSLSLCRVSTVSFVLSPLLGLQSGLFGEHFLKAKIQKTKDRRSQHTTKLRLIPECSLDRNIHFFNVNMKFLKEGLEFLRPITTWAQILCFSLGLHKILGLDCGLTVLKIQGTGSSTKEND